MTVLSPDPAPPPASRGAASRLPAPERRGGRLLACLGFALLALVGCATVPPASDPEALAEFRETNDPLEPMNRAVYVFNDGADTLLLRPAGEAYRVLVPPPIRTRVGNVLANLNEPLTLINDFLQGSPDRAEITLSRFLINSTFGLAGLFDVATDWGYPHHTEDFGQTLAVWGTGEGPYLMLPLLGPSNPRDLTGRVVDWFADPWGYVVKGGGRDALTARTAIETVDTREKLIEPIDTIRREALDPYATVRSLYRQRRNAEIANQLAPRRSP